MTEFRHDQLQVRVLRDDALFRKRSSIFSVGLPLNPQLQVEVSRASTIIPAVPFPWKLETHPIRGSPRNGDRHDPGSFVTAAAFTDDAGDLGDAAVAVAPGAGVDGGEDPKRAA
jgi:hypothetical protein